MIAGNYNVAQAIELSDTASMNGKPQWVMKNYDGSTFFCSEDKLLVACKEDMKMWCIANKQHTTDFPVLHGQGSLETLEDVGEYMNSDPRFERV